MPVDPPGALGAGAYAPDVSRLSQSAPEASMARHSASAPASPPRCSPRRASALLSSPASVLAPDCTERISDSLRPSALKRLILSSVSRSDSE